MTITYRNSGAWDGSGTVKGSRLTSAEVDGNFWELVQQIADATATGNYIGIASISISGNILTITLSDSSEYDLTIPTATMTWRGEWAAGQTYAAMDLFTEHGTLYLVLLAHTAATSFDSGETDGLGHDLYQKILDFPSIPVYETTAATFTPALIHSNSYIRCTNGAGCAVTIPADDDVAFPLWTEFHFRDVSTVGGLLTIEAPTSVTINIPDGYSANSAGKHATIGIKKVATDEWDMFGLLATVTV